MVCHNCNRAKADHVQRGQGIDRPLWCIGVKGTWQPKVTNIDATFLFVNAEGNAESRDAKIMHVNRRLARLDNIVEQLLRDGMTDISINLKAS